MTPAATLLHKLLEYINEQAKDIDPRGFRLSTSKNLLWRREGLVGLPGLEFDLKVDGDHIWLRLRQISWLSGVSPDLRDRCSVLSPRRVIAFYRGSRRVPIALIWW